MFYLFILECNTSFKLGKIFFNHSQTIFFQLLRPQNFKIGLHSDIPSAAETPLNELVLDHIGSLQNKLVALFSLYYLNMFPHL